MNSLRALPALRDNYIWMLSDDASGLAIVVDPGEARPALDALAAGRLTLTAILLTHHHADHVGGVPELVARFPGAAVYAPHDNRIQHVTRRVRDGDIVTIDAPSIQLRVIAVPGHTRHHIAYHGADLLFSGDTLFSLGCGRLFEGSPAQMLESLDRLASLPDTTQVCCGHEYTLANAAFAQTVEPGNPVLVERIAAARQQRARSKPTLPALLSDERAANPFLRVDAIADERIPWPGAASASTDRVQRFAALRLAKDRFRA